mmetsp:Transcript_6568/g.18571  ORF Transcript_6568/g.18571 Transcript_6568/m.18571 type:complete len:563 (+) Transcript_6568:113-1801(+)
MVKGVEVVVVVGVVLMVAAGRAEANKVLSSIPKDASSEAVVTTEGGQIVGVINDTARAFLGIPYGNAPIGPNRWRPTIPRDPWFPDVLTVQEFGAGCPQLCNLPPDTCPYVQSEDCLFLDIFTPRLDTITEPRPVMVFFHGGNFQQGSAGTLLYDGSALANRTDVVVVVANYRLGALGFLVNQEIQGNYGFMDQQFVLGWVRRNIASFGGNQNLVTIFGQSAGGTSTAAHQVAPSSFGLYDQIISESNPVALNLNTLEKQREAGAAFAEFAGCANLTNTELTVCLHQLDVDTILAAQAKVNSDVAIFVDALFGLFYPWTPTVDYDLIPGQPVNLIPEGKFNRVPMIVGSVTDEAWLFIWQVQPFPVPTPEYNLILKALFPGYADQVAEMYPVPKFALDTRVQINNLITDYLFTCPIRYLARNVRTIAPEVPLYKYQFNHCMSFYEGGWGPHYEYCYCSDEMIPNVVCHGGELAFVFDTAALDGYVYQPGEDNLAHQMVSYWGNFAHTGDPNNGPASTEINWPLYDPTDMVNLDLNITIRTIDHIRQEYCDFWDTITPLYMQP